MKKDIHGRLWLGTYQGLQILNNRDKFLDTLQKEFRNKPVWAIEFYHDKVIIGTRFNGLHIFDLVKNQRVASYDSAEIGLCRKFRLLGDTLYIATKANPFYLPLETLKLHKINTAEEAGFCTDFERWGDDILVSSYQKPGAPIFKILNDSLYRDDRFNLVSYLSQANSLSLEADNQQLIVGGNGINLSLEKNTNQRHEYLLNPLTGKELPSWDIEIVNGRAYTAVGEPDNTQQGMIHEMFVTTAADLKNQFYGLSLLYDSSWRGMWAGTENAGLFYWPAINSYFHLPSKVKTIYKWYRSTEGRNIVFDDLAAFEVDLSRHQSKLIYREPEGAGRRALFDVKSWHDTVAVLSIAGLQLTRNGKALSQVTFNPKGMYNTMERIGNVLFLFGMYGDIITSIDLKSGSAKTFPAPSNQVKPLRYRDGIFYYSTYKGFVLLDSIAHPLKPELPAVEDFAINNDTLWTLSAEGVTMYKINFRSYNLDEIRTNDLKGIVSNFLPKWIKSVQGNVYCGNNYGFFKLSPFSLLPEKYFYLGNFSELDAPRVYADTFYFQHPNYLAKITPQDLEFKGNKPPFNVSILPDHDVYEYSPFSMQVESNDYLLEKKSLKQLLLIRKEDTVSFYTISNRFDINAGLPRGAYQAILTIDGQEIERRIVHVAIPLTSNPVFYLSVFLIVCSFAALWIRYILSKKGYEKQILNNRLQLLKQNLNPHFIFNSLNLIYSLVLQKKNDAAITTINDFADLHRYYLQNINKPTISLKEEMSFIASYLKLESLRRQVDTPFSYTIDDPSNEDYHVPPMILQPLVENAVKYCGPPAIGLKEAEIWINVGLHSGKPSIFIENTVASGQTPPGGNGLGLSLVRERIDIYNKSFRADIFLLENLPPEHCSSGYRVAVLL